MADVDTSAGKNQRFLCRLKHFISFLQLSSYATSTENCAEGARRIRAFLNNL